MNSTSGIAVRRSIALDVSQARAFETFLDMTAWWPLATHTTGTAPARASVVEARLGGRWYEIDASGERHEIGRVLAYEPPERIVLSWEISCSGPYDPSLQTEVDVQFIAETTRRTRVELEHRKLEAFGDRADEQRKRYDGDDAWTFVLGAYAASFAAPVK